MHISRILAPSAVAVALALAPVAAVDAASHARTDPGQVSNLRVSGTPTAKVRLVTWGPPTVSTFPIANYLVTIKQHHAEVISFTVVTPSATLHRKDFKSGSYKVIVVAATKDGQSPKVSVKFSVRKPAHH